MEKSKLIRLQIDNKATLSYLLKMGGTRNEHMIKLSKDVRYYLQNNNMFITVEYLSSVMNSVVERELRIKLDSLSQNQILCPKAFQAVC